ncbi:MAG: hypothetical protein R3E08_02720 [Thiotrichaceae bacterium]
MPILPGEGVKLLNIPANSSETVKILCLLAATFFNFIRRKRLADLEEPRIEFYLNERSRQA